MADPLSSSLLDAHEERKGGTTYSLYAEPSTEPSLFKRFFSSRRHLVIFAAVSLIVALAIIIPFVASAAGKGEPVFPSTDSSSSTGTSPPPDMTSSAAALSSAMPSSDPSSSSSFDLSSSAQSSSALSSSAQSSSAVSSSALSSSAQSSSASAMWSSSSSVAPIYTVNRTIAGMFVTQHGQGDRVVIVMPNVFGIGANLWNLSLSYAMAGYRSYAVDTVYGDPMPPNSPASWWAAHYYNKTVASMQAVVDDIRSDSSVRSIQAVGFCYGGGVALGMLGSANMPRPISAAVSAHPTWLNNGYNTLGNLTQLMSGEVFFIMPDRDPFFNEQADQWVMAMWRRRRGSQFTIYPDTDHGFGIDAPRTPHAAAMKAKSIRDTISWLNEHDNVR